MVRFFFLLGVALFFCCCSQDNNRSPSKLMSMISDSKNKVSAGNVASVWSEESILLMRELDKAEGYSFVFVSSLGFDVKSFPFDLLSQNSTWEYSSGVNDNDSLIGVLSADELLSLIDAAMANGDVVPVVEFGKMDLFFPRQTDGDRQSSPSVGSVSAVEDPEKQVTLSDDEYIDIGGVFPDDIIGGTVYTPEGWYRYPFKDADGNLTGDGVIVKLGFPDFANKEINSLKDLSNDYAYIYYLHGRSDIDRKQFKGKHKKVGNMNGSTVFVYPASEGHVGNLFLYPLYATYFRSNIPADSEFAVQYATEIAMIVFSFKGK